MYYAVFIKFRNVTLKFLKNSKPKFEFLFFFSFFSILKKSILREKKRKA